MRARAENICKRYHQQRKNNSRRAENTLQTTRHLTPITGRFKTNRGEQKKSMKMRLKSQELCPACTLSEDAEISQEYHKRSVTKGTCITSPVKPKKKHAGPLLITRELTVPRNQTWSYVNNFDICASARSCQRKFSPKKITHTHTLSPPLTRLHGTTERTSCQSRACRGTETGRARYLLPVLLQGR